MKEEAPEQTTVKPLSVILDEIEPAQSVSLCTDPKCDYCPRIRMTAALVKALRRAIQGFTLIELCDQGVGDDPNRVVAVSLIREWLADITAILNQKQQRFMTNPRPPKASNDQTQNTADLDSTIHYQDYSAALNLLREAHERMGNTAFPSLAARIALFLKTAPSVGSGSDSSADETERLGEG